MAPKRKSQGEWCMAQDGHDDSDTTDDDKEGATNRLAVRELAREEERAMALDARELFAFVLSDRRPGEEYTMPNRKITLWKTQRWRLRNIKAPRIHRADCVVPACQEHHTDSRWDYVKKSNNTHGVPTSPVEANDNWVTSWAGRRHTRVSLRVGTMFPSGNTRIHMRKSVDQLIADHGYTRRGAKLRNVALADLEHSDSWNPREFLAGRWATGHMLPLHNRPATPMSRATHCYEGPTTRSRHQAHHTQIKPWPPQLYVPALAALLATGRREVGTLPTGAYLRGMPTPVVVLVAEYAVTEVQVHFRCEHVPLDPNNPNDLHHLDSREELCARPVRSHTHTHTHTHTHIRTPPPQHCHAP